MNPFGKRGCEVPDRSSASAESSSKDSDGHVDLRMVFAQRRLRVSPRVTFRLPLPHRRAAAANRRPACSETKGDVSET